MKKTTTANALSREYGEFVYGFADWEYFLTLTPIYRRSQPACRRLADKVFNRLSATAFWVTERNPDKGGYHVHALLKSEHDQAQIESVIRQEHMGPKYIVPYDAKKGAAFYINKYVTVPGVDYDLVLSD